MENNKMQNTICTAVTYIQESAEKTLQAHFEG
jgi:hypothetical protein